MKLTAVALILLAVGIAVAPLFLECQYYGLTMKLANGMSAPMKCHWTAMAEIGIALPLAAVGAASGFSKSKEARRVLAIVGMALGLVAIMVPAYLIGVCPNEDMLCNALMRPALILMGVLTVAASMGSFAFARGTELAA